MTTEVDKRDTLPGMDRRSLDGAVAGSGERRPGFLRRHRLPLLLAFVALCLYAGSILYILYGRGQIA